MEDFKKLNKKKFFIKGYYDTQKNNLLMSFFQFLFRKIIGFFIKIIWIKDVKGINKIPKKGPLIVIANHQGHFDFLSISAVFPRNIYFLSAEKLFKGFLNIFLRGTGQIKVERNKKDKRKMNNTVYHLLKKGSAIAIYPEGTRCPYEDKMLRGFTGFIKYALWHDVPILPIGIKGSEKILSLRENKIHFKKIIELNIGDLIYLDEYQKVKQNKKSFQVITNKIMKKLSDLSGKKYPYEC